MTGPVGYRRNDGSSRRPGIKKINTRALTQEQHGGTAECCTTNRGPDARIAPRDFSVRPANLAFIGKSHKAQQDMILLGIKNPCGPLGKETMVPSPFADTKPLELFSCSLQHIMKGWIGPDSWTDMFSTFQSNMTYWIPHFAHTKPHHSSCQASDVDFFMMVGLMEFQGLSSISLRNNTRNSFFSFLSTECSRRGE